MTKDSNWGVGICHYTGNLIQKGYFLQHPLKYFSTVELLIKYLREIDDEELNDRDLLDKWYDHECIGEGFYYSEWLPEDANYVEIDGDLFNITINHRTKKYI